jgi:ATP/maltotriose-dependent transcriptional regulator MalT
MSDKRQQPYEPLTDRELEILRLIADSLTNQQIADQLFLSLETVKWHNKLSYQKLRVRSLTQAVARVRELDLLEATAVPQLSPRSKHNLPTQTTPFIGREAELAEIRQLLLDEPGCRLLTLFGPGGIGKSRLQSEPEQRFIHQFDMCREGECVPQ